MARGYPVGSVPCGMGQHKAWVVQPASHLDSLANLVPLLEVEPRELLSLAGGRPEHLQGSDAPRVTQPDLLAERVRAEAGAAADRAVDGARPAPRVDGDLDPRPDRLPVRAHAHQLDPEPGVEVAGVLVERAVGVVR